MNANISLVNAWIFLNEDEPAGTDYNSPNSCYQTLIQNNVYRSVDVLYLCFVTTTPTGAGTIPAGDGSSYTIQMGAASHPGGLTNQDYMDYVIRDSRKRTPTIKIGVTLNWGDGNLLANIFSNTKVSPQQNAANFAANLMTYLKHYDLDGFDIDWEYPISDVTTQSQFALLVNAIGAQFQQQKDKPYLLSLSPAQVGNLDATATNNNVSYLNLQLYSGFTSPQDFVNAGVNPKLFAYGAKWESDFQTAQQAFDDNQKNYRYSVYTCWRLNSSNYVFEQTQQVALHKLIFPSAAEREKATTAA
ncbi:MAG: glycoside hydrolase family 18 protein [Terriglobales bacterium]